MAKSTSSAESLSKAKELEKFYESLIEASEKVQKMKLKDEDSK